MDEYHLITKSLTFMDWVSRIANKIHLSFKGVILCKNVH